MSYQLKEEMTEWEEDTDKMLHMLPILGTVFRKTYFDAMKGRNVSELIFPKYLVVNNFARDMETAPRVTHEFELYPDEITERVRSDMFLDIELGSPTDYMEREDAYGDTGDSRMSAGDDDAPHVFLEQHRSLDLDEDGYGEPYIVTVHKDTSQVVRIIPRFEKEDVFINKRGEIAKIEAINYFTKFSFIPSPDGSFYDIGYGDLLYNINSSINSIINQLLDAGHLANTGGGFIGKGLRIKGGNIRLRPGEWKISDSTGAALKDSIVPIPHAQPSPVLFELLGMLIESGKEVASMKDIMSGEQASNQTAAATMALIEQGMTSFKAVYKRFYRSLKQEFKKLYKLNSIYLSQEEYFNVMDSQHVISVEDYNTEDVDIVPVADISAITNMQKITKAEFLQQFIDDPSIDGLEIRRRIFEAWNIERVDELVAKVPPAPDPMVEFGKTSLENERIKLELEAAKIKIQENDSETKRLTAEANAVESLAKAEGVEVGTQLDSYKQELEELKFNLELGKQLDERSDDTRRVGSVETPSNNQEGI
jgi:chaperonin GroES